MKKLLILMFIGMVAAWGYYDGGDVTGAVVLGLLVLPGMFEGKDSCRGKILRQAQDDRCGALEDKSEERREKRKGANALRLI